VAAAKEIPEITAALEEFVAAPGVNTTSSDPLDLKRLAAELRLLPAFSDMGGCYGIRPSGVVASFAWDEPHMLQDERDTRICNMVYYQASLKYPSLVPLVPTRSADAVTCSCCGGSGRVLDFPDHLVDKVLCYCGGLGWLPGQNAKPDSVLSTNDS